MEGQTAGTQAQVNRRERSRRILLAVLYLLALALLILWESHDRLALHSSSCDLQDQTKPGLYSKPYTKFLDWSSQTTASHVVAVAIPSDLEDIQGNVCQSRVYLADVLRVLSTKSPAVVTVDRFFGPSACSRDPQSTAALVSAVRQMNAPVIIGESTDGANASAGGACLVRKPQLDFGAANVRHGLTRLDSENERFPLEWPVLSSQPAPSTDVLGSGESQPKVDTADSLALASVRAYDPEFAQRPAMQRLIHEEENSFARLNIEVPLITTTDILCASDDVAVRRRWGLTCADRTLPVRLLGKVVLIGAEGGGDQRIVLGKQMWGFQLQALYIESLLSGDYLRPLPVWVGFAIFAGFVFAIEGLPVILSGYRPELRDKFLLRYAYPRRRYVWVVFWAASILVVCSIVSLFLRFLPPLLVYGDILLIAVTRLIYFSAESAEHPFVHAHDRRGNEHNAR